MGCHVSSDRPELVPQLLALLLSPWICLDGCRARHLQLLKQAGSAPCSGHSSIAATALSHVRLSETCTNWACVLTVLWPQHQGAQVMLPAALLGQPSQAVCRLQNWSSGRQTAIDTDTATDLAVFQYSPSRLCRVQVARSSSSIRVRRWSS